MSQGTFCPYPGEDTSSNYAFTPLKAERSPAECPRAPGKVGQQSVDSFSNPPRRLGFEREELDDDDEDTDSDDGDLPELDLPEIRFLHKQLKLINAQHAHLSTLIRNETKNVRAALRSIRRSRRKACELENQSWSINSILGRTDKSDYIGLE